MLRSAGASIVIASGGARGCDTGVADPDTTGVARSRGGGSEGSRRNKW